MVKTVTSVSIDVEPYLDCKMQHKNISAICNKAIWEASRCAPDTTKVDLLRQEADRIEKVQGSIKQQDQTKQTNMLEEFLTKTSFDSLNNDIAMAYWIKQTGKTKEELIKLKQEAV